MRFVLCALAALLVAGCTVQVIVIPLPVPVAVTPAPVAAVEATPTPFVVTDEMPQVIVPANSSIAIFPAPDLRYGAIGWANGGDTSVVLGRTADNQWLQVMYGSETAWVPVDSVVPFNPEAFGPGGSAIPVVTPPGTPTPTPPWLTAP